MAFPQSYQNLHPMMGEDVGKKRLGQDWNWYERQVDHPSVTSS
jgi:hypothetical protein